MIYGFFGGKFLPLHKGHLYCIDVAASQCDHVTVIMFTGGDDELRIARERHDEILDVGFRTKQLERGCVLYPNVTYHVIDVTELKLPDGTEDWDAETPLVRKFVPVMDYVYSSEPSYGTYFARAYPEAVHIVVDEHRLHYPISGTLIRAMKEWEEREKWMV